MIDFMLLAVLAIVTWCVASEGTWGAATVFLSVLFAGLVTMNCFEPLAAMLEGSMPGMAIYCDILAYLGLFAAFVFVFRAAGEYLMPTYIDVHGGLHNSVRWLLAAATGYGQRNLRNAWHDLEGLGALEWSRVAAGVRAVRLKDCPQVWAPAAASAEVRS